MLGKYAWQFFLLSRFLADLYQELDISPPQLPAPGSGINVPTNYLTGALTGGLMLPSSAATLPPPHLSNGEREHFASLLELMDSLCTGIGIVSVSGEVSRATSAVRVSGDRSKLKFHIENLGHRVTEELGKQLFLHVPTDKARHYRQADLFGSAVGKKFAKSAEDISNAGTCYALGQNTACVFHLMRVMEQFVHMLGKKLKVPIDVSRESWHQIMLHVHKGVDALPSGARAQKHQNIRKQQFATAASRLDHVRLAWRNDVMHPKATYDEAEALEVLTSVKTFVNSIVNLV